MKKVILKFDPVRLVSQPTHVLQLALETHGVDGRFLDADAFRAVKAELARRGNDVLSGIGFTSLEVESAGSDDAYPTDEEVHDAEQPSAVR